MKYIAPLFISLPIFYLPFVGNRSITWGMAILIFIYFWIGVGLGEGIGKE